MNDSSKTTHELLEENATLKKRVQELEQFESAYRKPQAELQENARGLGFIANTTNSELLQNIFDHSPYLIYAKDLDGRFMLASRSLALFFGQQTPETLLGKTSYDFLPKATADQHHANDLQVVAQQTLLQIEETVETRDGLLAFIATKFPLFDHAGKPYAVCGVSVDISDRKRMEQAIQDAAERSRAMLQTAMDGFWRANKHGYLLEVNATYCRMSGYSEQELLTMCIRDLELVENPDDTAAHMQRIIAHGMDRFESRHRRKDGSVYDIEVSVQYRTADGGQFVGFLRDITARKKSQEETRELLRMLEAVPNCILAHDGDGTLLYANQRVIDLHGYSRDEFMALNLGQICTPASKERISGRIQEVFDRGAASFETEHLRKDGTILPLLINAKKGTWEGKQVFLSVQTDITERRRAEEVLAHERERLAAIIRGTNVGTWEWNVQTGEALFNDRWAEIIGYSLDELSPVSIETWMKLAHPDDLQQSNVLIERHFTGELDYYEYESRMKHRNGDWIWVLDRGKVASWTDDGKPLLMFGTHQDITGRKRAETALRESEEKFRNIIDISPVPYALNDDEGNIIFLNEAFTRSFGYALEDIPTLADWWSKAYPDRDYRRQVATAWEMRLEKARREGTALEQHEVTIACKDGLKRTAIVSATRLTKSFEGTHLVILYDITERKQAEKEKASLEGQLQHAQKMDAIGTLAGGVAHDFNNILGAIIGYTEMAMDEDQKEIRRTYLQETLRGAERAKDLVRQILSFSRQGSHEKRPLDIKLLLKEAVKFLRASIPATVEIQQRITDELCIIVADSTQMHQVIMNLCTNATHAMKQAGGVLTIELSPIELSEAEIPRHPGLRQGPYIRLTVSDTGHGIDPAHMARIFDPFFTTKPAGEGTGLGLSVVYGIIKSHDGAIHADSEPGKGASFSVYLPRIIHESITGEIVASPPSKGTERILFVDDERALVDICTSMLSSLGYQVSGANSSADALDLFRADPESFDLVITDMTLPKMTGIDLAGEMQRIRPDISIILCSGIHEAVTAEQVKSLGIKAYSLKPLTKRDLSRIVRETLDGL